MSRLHHLDLRDAAEIRVDYARRSARPGVLLGVLQDEMGKEWDVCSRTIQRIVHNQSHTKPRGSGKSLLH